MVFDWIVHRIRLSLEPEGVNLAGLPHIGVLDIFGFESFDENGLEQLLINYGESFIIRMTYFLQANESLQLTFNQSVLQAEQDLYIDEGMMISPVEFIDNSSCVELIARSKDSIINTLDSVCRAPAPTEEKFNSFIHQVFCWVLAPFLNICRSIQRNQTFPNLNHGIFATPSSSNTTHKR